MRKLAAILAFIVCLGQVFIDPQPVEAASFISLSGLERNIKVNPFLQAGFQWVGSNMTLPVAAELIVPGTGSLQIGSLDISLKDANFWSGTAGLNVTAKELFSLFAAVGGFAPRPFGIAGEIPVSVGGVASVPVIEFTASRMGGWYAQAGVGLGPIITGLYWDHFLFDLKDPRQGEVPLANQTLRGDVFTKTVCPFIGAVLPVSGAMFTIMYSPLAWSKAILPLRSSQNTLSELTYSWTKPGTLLSGTVQYNMALVSGTTFGLWGNYTWLNMRGTADLDFENTNPPVTRSKDVTATMTKYVLGGGITLGINF